MKEPKESFRTWLWMIKKEQKNYPYLKGRKLDEDMLRLYYDSNMSPIDTLNDILTIV